MGSPAEPNTAQRVALERAAQVIYAYSLATCFMATGAIWLYMATSQVGAAAAAVVPINATASLVEVLLRENSAVVVIFS